jgi:hypothetical protein
MCTRLPLGVNLREIPAVYELLSEQRRNSCTWICSCKIKAVRRAWLRFQALHRIAPGIRARACAPMRSLKERTHAGRLTITRARSILLSFAKVPAVARGRIAISESIRRLISRVSRERKLRKLRKRGRTLRERGSAIFAPIRPSRRRPKPAYRRGRSRVTAECGRAFRDGGVARDELVATRPRRSVHGLVTTAALDNTCYPRSGITASLVPPPRSHGTLTTRARDTLLHMIPRISVRSFSSPAVITGGTTKFRRRFRDARTCAWNIHLGIFRP